MPHVIQVLTLRKRRKGKDSSKFMSDTKKKYGISDVTPYAYINYTAKCIFNMQHICHRQYSKCNEKTKPNTYD